MAAVKLWNVRVEHLTKKWVRNIEIVGGKTETELETEDYHRERILRNLGYDPHLELYAKDKIKLTASFIRESPEFINI